MDEINHHYLWFRQQRSYMGDTSLETTLIKRVTCGYKTWKYTIHHQVIGKAMDVCNIHVLKGTLQSSSWQVSPLIVITMVCKCKKRNKHLENEPSKKHVVFSLICEEINERDTPNCHQIPHIPCPKQTETRGITPSHTPPHNTWLTSPITWP